MVVIGSGNVAWHMVHAFTNRGVQIRQILGRNEKTTRALADKFSVPFALDPEKVVPGADLYLVAVRDDQVRDTALGLRLPESLIVHTSGFHGIEVLAGASARTGVLWPLQTLTTGHAVNYQDIPIFLEANNKPDETRLVRFAGLISGNITVSGPQERARAHLAAVVACNLSNHLFTLAAKILEDGGIPFSVLGPLILETARKATASHPSLSQTGPAVRNDMRVIRKHLDMLGDDPDTREIYRLISDSIIHQHKDRS